jgi:hypothetical protein
MKVQSDLLVLTVGCPIVRKVCPCFVVVRALEGEFTFLAPWGEKMIARPGDVIVQDVGNAKDTYRIQKAAFACTYAVERQPSK